MILFIDTSDFENLRLALVGEEKVSEFSAKIAFNENYKTNKLLDEFLKANQIEPKNLSQIFVCNGPGSFTGIRVGVSLAQALGFALSIPVQAIQKEDVPINLLDLVKIKANKKMVLHYGAEPNITQVK